MKIYDETRSNNYQKQDPTIDVNRIPKYFGKLGNEKREHTTVSHHTTSIIDHTHIFWEASTFTQKTTSNVVKQCC